MARGSERPEDAEGLAIKVLNHIVADLDRMIQFLNVTGLQPETIRASAKSPLFLLGVLDYVSKDDELLETIHQELGIRPAAILMAAVHLTPEPETKPPSEKPARTALALPRRSLYR
ncbi:DUF3572 domain-containing protein [Microvirga puerhi]|uniref:DUF3572 domain-containing protein n=1 Tax=Microvirga puerhi TaxID=2876078 RepID=A0ABS7VV85_9HYPH|nr:DUF3572 domain-containing protein [Microvirga puerhi]MBZ6079089.1 DUF3572 domain-containing protein [Microvirga puerhi]